ncbi:glycosyltransferase family 4 protein [Candidatus Woesearchaeota archaeon]|nr:glycosyltransferase family 4 protein [Candidatus Woesearchaeota archaeon]
MKPIKVAVVIPTHTNLKSSLHVLIEIYKHLKTKNVDATIFTDSKNQEIYGLNTVKIKGFDYNTVLSKVLFALGLPRYYYSDLIDKLKGYDIIETSNPEFYIFAYQSYLAAKKYNAKLILRTSQTVEGFLLFKLSRYIVIPIVKKAYNYASWLFFTNPEAAERAESLGLMEKNCKRKVITGHAVDTSVFKPLNIKKSKKTVILSVAGLYKIKGHHLIIEALAKVRENHDAELWIVGGGYYKKNLELISEHLGLSKHVKFLGSKSKKELAQIYNMATIFVLANYQEITPAVNEALACGTPVVVMECGGRRFVIPNESYGLVAKKFDTDDIADKIIKLIENKRLAQKIAKNGRAYVLKNFSLEGVAEKFYRSFTKE